MRVTLIHSPRSGASEHDEERLVDLLRECGHHVRYYSTETEAWRAAIVEPAWCVAVAGGDGTVAEVARALAGRAVPIAVLPLGTANNIAGALGLIPAVIPDLVSAWPDAIRQPFDLGIARGFWGETRFLESIGVGLLSDTIADIDHGDSGHVNEPDDPDVRIASALDVFERVVRTAAPMRYRLTLDERDLSGDYLMVEALNFGAAGPNLRFTSFPNGSDGLLDVVLVDHRNRDVLLDHLTRSRSHPDSTLPLPTVKARHMALSCDACVFHVDDTVHRERAGELLTVDVSLQQGAVTFLVPRARSGSLADPR